MGKFVEEFLERNGFEMVDETTFKNDKCTVVIHEWYYEIYYYDEDFSENMAFFTDSLKIPELLGNLLWHKFIDKDFKR